MKNAILWRVCALAMLLLLQTGVSVNAQSVVAKGYNFTPSQKTFNYLNSGTRINAVEVDDAFTTIPIGFSFRFCGVDFTNVTVCSNGWLRFGSGAGSSSPNWNYNASPNSGIEPAVYAFYEDVSGDGGTSTYEVTGAAPNRIFKWECRNWLWDYAASSPSISFQVWLYEGTGEIECIYQQESGAASVGTSGGATIGIGNSSTDWQVLDGTGANPTSSSTSYTANLSKRPASGQSYMWDPGPACAPTPNININLLNSTTVDFSWTPVGSVSQGYEYVVDQNSGGPAATSTPTATSNTNAIASGLTPNTTYYIHVRNQCGTYNFSPWQTLAFQTLPPCEIPPILQVPVITPTTATVSWTGISTANEYEYVLKEDNIEPVSGANATTTTNSQAAFTGLTSGKTYFFFVRAQCSGMDSSDWVTDSIYIPIPCVKPEVKFSDLNSSRVVAYWNKPETAYEYEIIVSQTPVSNPANGIVLHHNSKLFPFLDPETTYYVYVRSYCEDRGVQSQSDWASASFDTWPLDIQDINNEQSEVKVYPNPAHDYVTIQRDGNNTDATIVISDVTGKNMYTINLSSDEVKIDIAQYPVGLYIIEYTDDNTRQQFKLYKK